MTNYLTRKEISEKFNIPYKRACSWIRDSENILQILEVSKRNKTLTKIKNGRKLKSSRSSILGKLLETKIEQWILEKRSNGKIVTNQDIKEKALQIARQNNIYQFKASNGWIQKFKKRFNFVMRKVTKTDKITIEEKVEVISDFKNGLKEKDFFFEEYWNSDETMINFNAKRNYTNNKKGDKQIRIKDVKKNKKTATVMLTVSNKGNKMPATIIFKEANNIDCEHSKKIKSDLTIPNNLNIYATKSGWMNRYAAIKWHKETFQDKPRGLLLDRAGAHRCEDFMNSLTDEQSINTIYLPAGCTDELQPLDISVNKIFKDYYKKYLTTNKMPLKKSFAQSERQHIINAVSFAWKAVPPDAIIRGFDKSGIPPFLSNPSNGCHD